MSQRREGFTAIGDLFGDLLPTVLSTVTSPKAKQSIKITRNKARLVEAETSIRQDPGTAENAAYMHVLLCHLGMPRSSTKERSFERRYERPHFRGALRMEAGRLWNGREFAEHPLPYGTKPRLVLMNVLTTAIRTQSPVVEVGHSMREYMKRLDIDPHGAEYRRFTKQIYALAACRMQMGMTYPDGRVLHVDAKPIQKFEAWLAPNSSTQQTLWPGAIELSPEFYNGLAGALVPIDERAAFALDGSLEMDIYFWLAQRLCRITDRGGQFITWQALKDQFAPEDYATVRKFKQNFLSALQQVMRVYPEAKIDINTEPPGLRLHRSKPPISKTQIPAPRLLR
jgi:hypothetical protein